MRTEGNRNFFEIWIPAQTTLSQIYDSVDGLFFWAEDWRGLKPLDTLDRSLYVTEVQVKTKYLDEFIKVLEGLGGEIL